MLKIDVRNVVNAIVEQELRGKGREHEALYINLDLRMSHHRRNKEWNQSRGLHLLYQVNPGYSYITIFSGLTDSPFGKLREVKDWKHETTHDSCWRDIQVYSQVYFDMAEKINAALLKDNRKQIAPKDMHEWHSFHHGLFMWVPVKITKDPQDERNYRKVVEVVF